MDLLESTAFGAALVFGFRHGFDWDHLAALTDLTGSQTRSRRAMGLATLYALGHAAMVVLLGTLAIVFAAKVPEGVDVAMERLVGASLVALGVWIVWSALRTRGAPPLRSRWMLLIEAVRRGVRRLHRDRPVVIEHAHPHDHRGPHQHPHLTSPPAPATVAAVAAQDHAPPAQAHHDHAPHDHAPHDHAAHHHTAPAPPAPAHSHVHRHVLPAVEDPFLAYGAWSSFGVGLLHGVGAETPTQVLVFAAAAHATDTASSIGVLLCFVAGLVAANTVVAAASTFGFRSVLARRGVMLVLAGVTAAFSLTVGSLLLLGESQVLPPIFA